MALTDEQKKLCDALSDLADIDHEIDELRSQEDTINERRRKLSHRRMDLENALRVAYAAAGYPGIAVSVNNRMVLFDSRTGVISFRLASPIVFALLASPTPTIEPCQPELLVAHPMSTTSIPPVMVPGFTEEDR